MDTCDIDTPFALVDLDRLEANIVKLQRYLDAHRIANRPHIKTHKIPEIAHMQLAAGAIGITCQKLGEAEVMAQAGIRDMFLPYNLLGAAKMERLARLARRVNLSVTADNEIVVAGLSAAMTAANLTLAVLVECDTGGKRCGVQTPEQAAQLARRIVGSPGLRFAGLMTYPSGPQTDPFVRETKALLATSGIAVDRVSGGGTPGMWRAHETHEVTEYRAGTYVYGDRSQVNNGAMTLDECALTVVATVISRPTNGRGILDAGSKALSSDMPGLDGYGMILEYPRARIYALSEEHGHVDFNACARAPVIGERVTIVPNHVCVVSNLFNQVIGARAGLVEVMWPVAARGLMQ
ncbi:MAG: D-TA family PLP-dependent enzyme [Chloroflexi bacterium]|nr:D-TA family PLP-dependent enzyme [Chloroflexota bacterium]